MSVCCFLLPIHFHCPVDPLFAKQFILAGPSAGGEFAHGDNSPRSVGVDYFREVCPHPKIISADEVNGGIGIKDPTAEQVMARWIEVLSTIDNRCVEVDRFSQQIFGYW